PLDMGETADNFRKFFRNQDEQQRILVTGSPDGTPYVRQYWDTTFFFHIKNLAFYYQGLALGVLGIFALGWYAICPCFVAGKSGAKAWYPRFASLLLVSWALPYFLIVGVFSFAKFARYMLPLSPLLALLAAAALDSLARHVSESKRSLVRALEVVVLLVTVGYGVGYFGTYLRPHPWVETSTWMLEGKIPMNQVENGVSRRTRVYNETWGDDLPVDVNRGNAGSYDNRKINIVEWDSRRKLAEFGAVLAEADVMVMADARAYGTYLRLATRFPLTFAYFDLMMNDPGKLGFELAHSSHNHMKWFGLFEINDSRIPAVPRWRWADESFTLYDRPHAFVFKKVRPITPEEVQVALQARVNELKLPNVWLQDRSPEDNRKAAEHGSTRASSQSTGTVATTNNPDEAVEDQRVNPNIGLSRGRMVPLLNPVLIWWVLASLLGLIALPLCLTVFKNFPDGGYALSRALGLFLFSWVAYNLAWLKILPFYQGRLWALLGLLLAASGFWAWRKKEHLRAWIKDHKREILWSEAIFAGAFLFYVAVRAFNPNIHDIAGQGYFGGGEPLGMTYLSAVTRCATFPVFDPWLALKDSSYYYFGYVMAGSMTKLSGYPPAITYNLSLALFFSLSLLSAYGVGRALSSKRYTALAGAGAVALFGSLWSVSYVMAQSSTGGHFNILQFLRGWFSHGFIWDPSRFPELVSGYIFEFPYFSYLYSDLHPHNMVVPISLVLTALLLVPFKSMEGGWRSFGSKASAAMLWFILAALILDAQYAINTWNWPVFLALSAGALVLGPWAGKKLGFGEGLRAACVGFGAFLLAVGIPGKIPGLGQILMRGFRQYFIQDGRGLGIVRPEEWQMPAYVPAAFYLFGLSALCALGGLRLRSWLLSRDKALGTLRLAKKTPLDSIPLLVERIWTKMPLRGIAAALGFGLAAMLLILSLPGVYAGSTWVFSLGLALLFFTVFCFGGFLEGGEAFIWMLGIFTLCLVAGAERFFVADRTNTIFKFWFNGWIFMGLIFGAGFGRVMEALEGLTPAKKATLKVQTAQHNKQLWILVASAAAVILAVMVAAYFDAPRGRMGAYAFSLLLFALLALATPVLLIFDLLYARVAATALFFALLVLGALYPLGATIARIADASHFRDPHLNGVAFMSERLERGPSTDVMDYDKYDAELISWLNTHADKTEVLLEAPGIDMYKGLSRFAIYTGLPTILGWDYQVGQQLASRAGNQLQVRFEDSLKIYHTRDVEEAKALLRRYKVRWIVVGSIERKLFQHSRVINMPRFQSEPDFQKFAGFCEVAQRNEGAVLYKFTDTVTP
ncbi:MAG: DUF2298 domain-containing protein, partial [candidate division FCPU426 bacterium]